jgi:hypothetical protein
MERKRVVDIAPGGLEFRKSHKEQGVAPNEPPKGCIQEIYNRRQDKRSHGYIQMQDGYIQMQERVWYCTISTKCSQGVTCHLRCSLELVFKIALTVSPTWQMFILSDSFPRPSKTTHTAQPFQQGSSRP